MTPQVTIATSDRPATLLEMMHHNRLGYRVETVQELNLPNQQSAGVHCEGDR